MSNKKNTQNTVPWYAPEYNGPAGRNAVMIDYLSLTPQEIKKELEKRVIGQEVKKSHPCSAMFILHMVKRENLSPYGIR